MGASLARAWAAPALALDLTIVSKPLDNHDAVYLDYAQAAALGPFDAVVLAVKPDQIASALDSLRALTAPHLVVSIAAGVTLDQLEQFAPSDWRCVRAMTSLAIAHGAGAAVAAASDRATLEDRQLCERLLPASAGLKWMTEAHMDAATALFGSGPAYFFRLGETLAAVGAMLGLEAGAALSLARDTLAGAGALAAEPDADLAALRSAVTSPGGTTAAALAVLDADDALLTLVSEAMAAGARRGQALSRLAATKPTA
jgi:pyrroline-5-carboxylate reductase